MLKDRIAVHYNEKDRNCAESILAAANEEYALGIPEESYKLVGGFGGGLYCERTCGALCGGIAVLGAMLVEDRAHAAAHFARRVGGLVEAFERELGTSDCGELKALYRDDEARCLRTVELAADVLSRYIDTLEGEGNGR